MISPELVVQLRASRGRGDVHTIAGHTATRIRLMSACIDGLSRPMPGLLHRMIELVSRRTYMNVREEFRLSTA